MKKRYDLYIFIFSIIFLTTLFSFVGCNGDTYRENPCAKCKNGEYEEIVITPATAFVGGIIEYVCSACGDKYEKSTVPTGSIKLLYVCDSSTIDCREYVYDMLKSLGVPNVTIAVLYSEKSSIESHAENIFSESTTYALSSLSDTVAKEFSITFKDGITYDTWDYIVMEEDRESADLDESYAKLSVITSLINDAKLNPFAKILWNVNWATSKSANTIEKYQGSLEKAQNAIALATKNNITENSQISGLIPTGTALQNIRSSNAANLISGDKSLSNTEKYIASLTWCSYITGISIEDIEWTPNDDDKIKDYQRMAKEAAMNALENNFEIKSPEYKSFKILIFGNSYGNDAIRYLSNILTEQGYDEIIIGRVGDSSRSINEHYLNLDDDSENDLQFAVHSKTVNGKKIPLPADYKSIIESEKWDFITFYQGPKSSDYLTNPVHYSELDNFVDKINEYKTNPDSKIIFYAQWAHNSTDVDGLYSGIIDITKSMFVNNPKIDGIIPAATMIQNLRSSYLDRTDITRDWGHLNYGVGRYAMALLWYAYLTEGDIDTVEYIPTIDEVSADEAEHFTPITQSNLTVIKEAIKNALKNPYEVTPSEYTNKP